MTQPAHTRADAPRTFWHYQDERGNDVVVDSVELVPSALRTKAVRVDRMSGDPLPPAEASQAATAPSAGGGRYVSVPETRSSLHLPRLKLSPSLHMPSIAGGMVATLLAIFIAQVMRRSGYGWLANVLLVCMGCGVLFAAYVDWGQGETRMAQLQGRPGVTCVESPTVQDVRQRMITTTRALEEATRE